MRLIPHERDRLLVFLAAELARRRRERGLELNQVEAIALITDEVMEAARDGLDYAAVERVGYGVLDASDVLEGVAARVTSIELEALFADGMRLLILEHPITNSKSPALADRSAGEVEWLPSEVALRISNPSAVAIAITSHVHLFEVNRELEFDRAAAWGMRLALAAGSKLLLEPGTAQDVLATPICGARVARGHGGLVDGPLDEAGARERALELARERGYRGV